MKRLLAIIFLGIVLFGAYWFFFKKDTHPSESKQEAIRIKKHSEEFNQSIASIVNTYLNMRNAFTDADSTKVIEIANQFDTSLDSLNLDDLKKNDSTILISARQQINDLMLNAQAMEQENNITEMREDFRMVSENLYPFLRTISYEGPKLYWLNCSMAFGEDKGGSWLSDTLNIINPYLGKNHTDCSEIKDSLQ